MEKKYYSDLNSEIVKNNLCVSCGACALACPSGALAIVNEVPVLQSACDMCGSCYFACPIRDMVYKATLERTKEGWLGKISNAAICRVNDHERLLRVGSGGAVTSLLALLLKAKKINAALVLRGNAEDPLRLEAILATTEDEILASAQSKYVCYPSLQSLRRLKEISSDYKIAVVGLPCQISSLERVLVPKAGMITYKLALYCGGVLKAEVIEYILKWFGVRREEIESLNYRYGRWPGYFRIKSKQRQFLIHKHTFNIFHLTHLKRGCLICDDFAGESSDLSFGDAWIKNGPDNPSIGKTVVLSRNRIGDQLLNMLKDDPALSCQQISPEEALLQHQHSAENRKLGSCIRKGLILQGCRNIPKDNRLNLNDFRPNRVFFERVYLSAIKVFSHSFGRLLITLIPIRLWDIFMVNLRGILIANKKRTINARV